jgi:DNA end-binding protein Ku
MGSATVSFGLVSIPVKLFPASQGAAGISFNMLHSKCKSRLKQQYVCPTDNEVVDRADIVKGYEFAKGQYVTLTDEELEAIEARATEEIAITEFVPIDKVDPVYFDKPYYLGPDKGGDKAYRLLGEAMERTGRCALAKYAARGKQYLVLVRPLEGRLVMQQLKYKDEVRSCSEVPVGEAELKDAELKLAIQLIEQIAADEFKPEAYEDEVKKRIQALLDRKVQGQEVIAAPPEAPKGQIIDLMEALKASLVSASQADGAAEDRKPPKRAEARKSEKTPKVAKKVS